MKFITTEKRNKKRIHESYIYIYLSKKTLRMMQHHGSVKKDVEENARQK